MDDRRFTVPVEEISGTVETATPGGITLKEFPGRKIQFSSVGMSAADISARILGEHNNMTREQVAREVERRQAGLEQYLVENLRPGTQIRAVVPQGAAGVSEQFRAVVMADGENINRSLIDEGYGQYREDLGGAESRSMHSALGRAAGSLAEGLSFQGDDTSFLNPMRYPPSPAHTKFGQERTPLDAYLNNEVVGTKTRSLHPETHKSPRTPAGGKPLSLALSCRASVAGAGSGAPGIGSALEPWYGGSFT